MGNGYTITAYRRVQAPSVAELDTYRAWLAEEDAQFPGNFSAVWDQLENQFANQAEALATLPPAAIIKPPKTFRSERIVLLCRFSTP